MKCLENLKRFRNRSKLVIDFFFFKTILILKYSELMLLYGLRHPLSTFPL